MVVSEGSEGSIHSEWQRSRSDVANLEFIVVSGFRVMNKSDHVDSYIFWSFSEISEHVVSIIVGFQTCFCTRGEHMGFQTCRKVPQIGMSTQTC